MHPITSLLLLMLAMHNSAAAGEPSNEDSGSGGGGSSHFVAILVAANVIVLVVILFLLIIYYKKYKKLKEAAKAGAKNSSSPREREKDSKMMVEKRTPQGGEKGKLVFMEKTSRPVFELDDLFRASAEGLGRGSFGNCYKAMLEVGEVVVVKRLIDLKPLSSEEFVRQVRAIADQKHPNLLPPIAYYYSKDERLFLYPFASHGNLFNRLHGGRGTRERVPFRWTSRLAAARGVARALEHLHRHTRSETTAPHGNLKSSNVLLDDDEEEPLVCDYGLTSLVALPVAAQRMVSYKAPEYQSHKRISKKSDVWSYGCLVLELLTGRMPAHSGTTGVDLCGWVNRAVREEWTAEIFDPEIVVHRGANQGMLRLMQIAMRCCDRSPEMRPDISQVVVEVEKVKAAVDSEDEEAAYSSLERSLTEDSYSANSSLIADDSR